MFTIWKELWVKTVASWWSTNISFWWLGGVQENLWEPPGHTSADHEESAQISPRRWKILEVAAACCGFLWEDDYILCIYIYTSVYTQSHILMIFVAQVLEDLVWCRWVLDGWSTVGGEVPPQKKGRCFKPASNFKPPNFQSIQFPIFGNHHLLLMKVQNGQNLW